MNNVEPPATGTEVHDAALQYVRTIAGTIEPSKADDQAFEEAVTPLARHLPDAHEGAVQ